MVAFILALAALLGVKVLSLFGVSLDAFQVAGGGVLAWMGFSMLKGIHPYDIHRRTKKSLTAVQSHH